MIKIGVKKSAILTRQKLEFNLKWRVKPSAKILIKLRFAPNFVGDWKSRSSVQTCCLIKINKLLEIIPNY